MRLPGIVTNVTAFGAFVDVGVHQDGLVHISHLADTYVKNPHDVSESPPTRDRHRFKRRLPRKRVAFSMKREPFGGAS